MQKLNILLLTFFLIACEQQTNNTPIENVELKQNVDLKQEAKVTEIIQPTFDCSEHKDLLKQSNFDIKAVQNIRLLNEREQKALARERKRSKEDHIKYGGIDNSNQYVFKQKVPGEIQGVCLAEVFLSDGSNQNILFTISDADDTTFITTQNLDALNYQLIMLGYDEMDEKALHETANQEEIQVENQIKKEAVETNFNTNKPVENQINKDVLLATNVSPETKINPSFNCDKASTIIEKTICSSNKLAKLDNNVALAYQNALNDGTDINLKASQKEWIRNRNTCQTEQCIEKAYVERWQDLAPWDFEQHD